MSNQQDTKKKNPNVPNLRFPSFTCEWEKTRLTNVGQFLPGLTYKPDDVSKNGRLVLRSCNIQNGELTLYDSLFVKESIVKPALSVRPYDVLMCIRNGSKKLVGKTALVLSDDAKLTWGAFMAIIRPNNSCSFLFHYLNSPSFRKQIFPDTNTATVNQITASIYNRCNTYLPNQEEQQRIASLLDIFDRRISVQNKIIEELLTLKKALYNKVFGTDAFNCRDVTLYQFMKMPDNVREMRPDRNKLITVRLNEGGVIKNTNVETLKMASTIYYRRSAGQFIYGKQNIFHGAFGIVPCHLDGYASSGDVPALDFKEGVNSSFLMRSMSFSCYSWEKYASGTGSKRIHEKSLLELQVRMPSSGYVERLEKMFAALEQRVERNRRTLNLYLTQKRYLLSQLFI